MVWAPDSTDLRAADSGHPDLWASDSRGQLTLGRAVELFLAAKAAEGASPRGWHTSRGCRRGYSARSARWSAMNATSSALSRCLREPDLESGALGPFRAQGREPHRSL